MYKITHSYIYPADIYMLYMMNGMTTVLPDPALYDGSLLMISQINYTLLIFSSLSR